MTTPTNGRTYQVLFICTQNSARSIMAEALLNHLGGGRFRGWSAGSHPAGAVHPMALQTLAGMGVPAEAARSKDWDEFGAHGAPALDFVLTVCDKAAGEACPVWPGQPMLAHWGVADPAAVVGDEAIRRRAFNEAAVVLKRRIELMLSLPVAWLDRMALQRELRDIGAR
jgi:arsenate reductase